MGKNIVLIGMMGSGKTTVGRLLARRLRRPCIDTDVLIEEREGRSIPDIFVQDGEDAFRALETALSKQLSAQSGLIIACGGGLPLREEAIAPLKENDLVFWLDRDPGETYDALDVSGRPLAQSGRDDFIRRYQSRAGVYRRWADYIIPCGDGPGAAGQLIATIYLEVTGS